jgi:ribonuclease P protein subunit RPR2
LKCGDIDAKRSRCRKIIVMAKAKEKSGKGVQNKHLYARASYMHQAAAYLSAHVKPAESDSAEGAMAEARLSESALLSPPRSATNLPRSTTTVASPTLTRATFAPNSGRHLLTQMRGVSRKTQTRISQDIKRSVCKRCDTLLVPGRTSSAQVENESKGGRKKCADVYVVRCLLCGCAKRFPVGIEKQLRKGLRVKKDPRALGCGDGQESKKRDGMKNGKRVEVIEQTMEEAELHSVETIAKVLPPSGDSL